MQFKVYNSLNQVKSQPTFTVIQDCMKVCLNLMKFFTFSQAERIVHGIDLKIFFNMFKQFKKEKLLLHHYIISIIIQDGYLITQEQEANHLILCFRFYFFIE